MAANALSGGTVHRLPSDLRGTLQNDSRLISLWEDITPLARNEFICWVESAQKQETRNRRVTRTAEELLDGQRRPCCWIGCVHRKDKAISPSVQSILNRNKSKS